MLLSSDAHHFVVDGDAAHRPKPGRCYQSFDVQGSPYSLENLAVVAERDPPEVNEHRQFV